MIYYYNYNTVYDLINSPILAVYLLSFTALTFNGCSDLGATSFEKLVNLNCCAI